ncbi:shikimate kinase [Hymenobacter ginsengisoli]|uniref:Shikimate kinase n=1 Tax=Hymenobacter ginsengisoli TaxID=1051626 RepID=A0ABP8QER5_9BACT|nr:MULTISPECIES: shikimate kinase [unclassified Hymenobacter]MBO2030234.1 shikimate kinase [Hymenobacter sp. BT559]
MSNHLYLIGLPASGKTTLGRQLAAHYGRGFLDLDHRIVAEAGQTIPEIFASEGEAGFRQREAAALAAVASQPGQPLVVATGGGTPCFFDNLAVLHASGFVLWLDVPPHELLRRLARRNQAATRPLLAATATAATPQQALAEWLARTLEARSGFYAQARLRHPGGEVAEVAAALEAAGFRP